MMTPRQSLWLLKWATVLLILYVTSHITRNYVDYFQLNFESEFLHGRESHFWGSYSFAFFVHLLTGPTVVLTGLVTMNQTLRRRFPHWHRRIGKLHILIVLLGIVPSGILMARYPMSDWIAGVGFACLALCTGFCAGWGWYAATKRRWDAHQVWMTRCFILLCSAILLRLFAGFLTVTEIAWEGSYSFSAWATWIVPLGLYELGRRLQIDRWID